MKRIQLYAVLAFTLASSLAVAGYKETSSVSVNVPNKTVVGQVGDARNSGDASQRLGCTVDFYSAYCYGVNAAGNSVNCYTEDMAMVNVAARVNGISTLYFIASGNGLCAYIQVQNYSYNRPMTP